MLKFGKKAKSQNEPRAEVAAGGGPHVDSVDSQESSTSRNLNNTNAGNLIDMVPGLENAITQGEVVDLLLPGMNLPVEDLAITNVIAVQIDPTWPAEVISRLSSGRRFILLRNNLQLIKDYRTVLRAAGDKLGIGGQLVITVPHQFLAERKFRIPSRYGAESLRFYTPASLLAEIEEALDATQYRISLLCDDDTEYDYRRPIGERPEGHQRIVLVIRKIARPDWADQMHDGDDVRVANDPQNMIIPKDTGPASTYILGAANIVIETILVIKLDHRGDYLMAATALKRLRNNYPDARITFVCGTWNESAARDSGLFDEIITLDFFAEDASTKREPDRGKVKRHFSEQMLGKSFDLAIDMRYLPDTRDLLYLINAKFKVGFDNWNSFPWLDIRLPLPSATMDASAKQIIWPIEKFKCRPENVSPGAISCRRKLGIHQGPAAAWGPYQRLDAGRYQATLQFALHRFGKIAVDVVCDRGQNLLFRGALIVTSDGRADLSFELLSHVDDVELRVFHPGLLTSSFAFTGATLKRLGVIVGVHQSEGMQLLVELAGMRLQQPYTRESEVGAAP